MRTRQERERSAMVRRAAALPRLGVAAARCLVRLAGDAMGDSDPVGVGPPDGSSAATAAAQRAGCRHEVRDDFFTAKAICPNVADRGARQPRRDNAEAARTAGGDLCSDQHEARAARRCANDGVVTKAFSPIDPGAFQHQYFARGVGKFLQVNPASGEVVQLVDCNVDPQCTTVPTP